MRTPLYVTVPPDQTEFVVQQAKIIRQYAKDNNVHEGRNFAGTDDESLENNINGFGLKMAFELLSGIYVPRLRWTTIQSDLPDIPKLKIQMVSAYEHDHHLIVNLNAPDDWRFVFGTGKFPDYRLWGFIWGHEAKKMKPRRLPQTPNRPPAHLWLGSGLPHPMEAILAAQAS